LQVLVFGFDRVFQSFCPELAAIRYIGNGRFERKRSCNPRFHFLVWRMKLHFGGGCCIYRVVSVSATDLTNGCRFYLTLDFAMCFFSGTTHNCCKLATIRKHQKADTSSKSFTYSALEMGSRDQREEGKKERGKTASNHCPWGQAYSLTVY
jgi:hypothetical protein